MVLGDYIELTQKGIETACWVSAPVLLFGLAAGLAISIFQAATQISDASLAFIPKIGAVVFALVVFGTFMISRISEFTIWVFGKIPGTLP